MQLSVKCDDLQFPVTSTYLKNNYRTPLLHSSFSSPTYLPFSVFSSLFFLVYTIENPVALPFRNDEAGFLIYSLILKSQTWVASGLQLKAAYVPNLFYEGTNSLLETFQLTVFSLAFFGLFVPFVAIDLAKICMRDKNQSRL
jgi:hypothetical protein